MCCGLLVNHFIICSNLFILLIKFFYHSKEPNFDSLSDFMHKTMKIQSRGIDIIFIVQKMHFTIKHQHAIRNKNREGNTKFYYHSKESKYDGLLVSKFKTMKIKNRDINIVLTVQKKTIYTQTSRRYRKK